MIDLIWGVLKFYWYGTVIMSKKSKFVFGLHMCMLSFLVIAVILVDDVFYAGLMFFIIIITTLLLGTIHYTTDIYPIERMRENFTKVFKDIKLQTEKKTPYFLAKETISKYVTVYSFKCYCPLRMWQAKRDFLEMYMNAKIVDIKQSEHDRGIIFLFTENEPLSAKIPWSNSYIGKNDTFNIGLGYFGTIGMDLEQHPHAFIAGETGSGKSNILKCFIYQALHKGFEVLLIDFKRGVSFAEFDSEVAVYYEYKDVIKVMRDMVLETITRLDKFRAVKVDNLKDYNNTVGSSEALKKKIVFIDELAELLKTRDREISNVLNDSIETLTRLSRAVGIHLIMSIQRPDSTITSGQIKNNVPFRVCGRFVDKEPSRIMLGNDSANSLPNIKGRFIVKDDEMHEIQGFYFRMPAKPKPKPEKVKQTKKATRKTASAPEPKQSAEQPTPADGFDFDFS